MEGDWLQREEVVLGRRLRREMGEGGRKWVGEVGEELERRKWEEREGLGNGERDRGGGT
jgi:hypothetical protein